MAGRHVDRAYRVGSGLNSRINRGGAANADIVDHVFDVILVSIAVYLLYRHGPYKFVVEGNHTDRVAVAQCIDGQHGGLDSHVELAHHSGRAEIAHTRRAVNYQH